MSIIYLTYPQIDKQKWDACINHCSNRLIYAKSFYLDAMAANWDALVLNDYEAVMPLTWKKKWGIRYLYQPPFIQQLGVFFTAPLTNDVLQDFMNKAFSLFKFAEITLNYMNDAGEIKSGLVNMRNNFLLPLQSSHQEIFSRFAGGTKKNINKSAKAGLQYKYSPHFMPILKLYKKLYGQRLPGINQDDFLNFSGICQKLSEQNNLIVRQVTNSQNELLSAVIILIDRARLYNIISVVTNEGRIAEANYFLYNELVKEFCKSKYVLDFEGSDVKGIEDFYKSFKPQYEPYPFIKINNLHPLLKSFKH